MALDVVLVATPRSRGDPELAGVAQLGQQLSVLTVLAHVVGLVDHDQGGPVPRERHVEGARNGREGDPAQVLGLLVAGKHLGLHGLRQVPPESALELGDEVLGVSSHQDVGLRVQ